MTETIAKILDDLDKLTGTYRRRVDSGTLPVVTLDEVNSITISHWLPTSCLRNGSRHNTINDYVILGTDKLYLRYIVRPLVTGLGGPAACPSSSGHGPFIIACPAGGGGATGSLCPWCCPGPAGDGGSPAANCSAAVVMTDDSAAAGPLFTRWNKPGKPVKTPRGGG